jgi:CRISPR-associated protein Cmr4
MADPPSTKQAARLLFLHAQTGLHPGSGTALGAVDMPVQRERHTHWPTIPGSAVKGVLRDACRETAKAHHGNDRKRANEEDAQLVAVFGPGKGTDASDHAGALALTDARLAAFPVRSLRGVFAWVTCPAVLVRLNRDLKLGGITGIAEVPTVANDEQLFCAANSPLLVGNTSVVLEEFEYTTTGTCDAVANWFAENAISHEQTRKWFKDRLVVISDNAFTHYARYASEVVARVALNYDTKTARDGALFYQEVLPAETLMYSVALAHDSRKEGTRLSADEVLNYLGGQLRARPVIQIGGDETVGKGLCFAHLTGGKGN